MTRIVDLARRALRTASMGVSVVTLWQERSGRLRGASAAAAGVAARAPDPAKIASAAAATLAAMNSLYLFKWISSLGCFRSS